MPFRTYLAWFGTAVSVGCLAIAGAAWTQFGRETIGSYARCELVRTKRDVAERVTQPKVIIVAGSSAVRGIVTTPIADSLGVPVINFGLHAGLAPDIILHEARKIARPGDVVVLAFEYDVYDFHRPDRTAVDYVLGCGADYFRDAPWGQRFGVVFGIDLARIIDAYRDDAARYWEGRSDGIARLDETGNIRMAPEFFPPVASDRIRARLNQPLGVQVDRAAPGVRSIDRFIRWARQHEVTVFATWPNTVYFEQYRSDPVFQEIQILYQDWNVPTLGTPFTAMFPVTAFYNTRYHLGIDGIRSRTQGLIATMTADTAFAAAVADLRERSSPP